MKNEPHSMGTKKLNIDCNHITECIKTHFRSYTVCNILQPESTELKCHVENSKCFAMKKKIYF